MPKLRHFRWPGINLAAEELGKRTEPTVFAGDRLRQAKAGVTTSTLKDSLELQEDELGANGEIGSNLKDFLKQNNKKQLLYNL